MRSTHRTLIDALNEETKPYTETVSLKNSAKFILLADRIDDSMGCLYLHSSISYKMVQALGQHLKSKLKDVDIETNISAPFKTGNLIIDFPNNDSKRHWQYITQILLRLPVNIVRDVSAPAFTMQLTTPDDKSEPLPLEMDFTAYDDADRNIWLKPIKTEEQTREEKIDALEYDLNECLDLDNESLESILRSLKSP